MKETLNPDGTRDCHKLDTIVHYMLREHVDVYLVQETWLVGTWVKEVHGITVFHHGPDETDCSS